MYGTHTRQSRVGCRGIWYTTVTTDPEVREIPYTRPAVSEGGVPALTDARSALVHKR
jgi:hypothetical protein